MRKKKYYNYEKYRLNFRRYHGCWHEESVLFKYDDANPFELFWWLDISFPWNDTLEGGKFWSNVSVKLEESKKKWAFNMLSLKEASNV